MDKSELMKIAIAALVAAVARELIAFSIKRSPVVARTLKTVAVSILNKHWRIFPIAGNLIVILLGMAFIVLELFDGSIASKRFVAFMVLLGTQFIPCTNDLIYHVDAYKSQFCKPEA